MTNPIEDALNFAYTHQLLVEAETPEWTPTDVMNQAQWFCDELKAVSTILSNALAAGDVAMLARASAQLQFTSSRQFRTMLSLITFTAGQAIANGPELVENKGRFENLYDALIDLDMVGGDVDGGRKAARMTDTMQQWADDAQDSFVYLMTSALREAGWSEDDLDKACTSTERPEFNAGLLENLDDELLNLLNNLGDEPDEK